MPSATVDQTLWRDDELELCPQCNSRKMTPVSVRSAPGFRYCLDCGMVPEPTAK